MGHDCTEPSTCPVCRSGIDMAPDVAMAYTLAVGRRPLVAEHERDDVTDRDRTRRIAQGALDVFLNMVLFTPGDRPLDVERLFAELKAGIVPSVREYRARHRQRFAADAAATGRLDEPDIAEAIPGSSSREPSPEDLTCEDP